jgi:predicted small secreted protein
MTIKSQILLLLILLCSGLALTACETMEGAGRDIEHAGENVQDAAD